MRNKLVALRGEHCLTQAQMAERLGVTRETYGNVERGKSNGSLNFWLAVKREFPETDIETLAKVKTDEKQA